MVGESISRSDLRWRVRSPGTRWGLLLVGLFAAVAAVIIGTATFGKGSVNLLRELSNEGGLYLTVARWYTPNGRLIEEEGVAPDVIVEFEGASLRDFDYEDPQLAAAVEQLNFQTGAAALP